jgi:Spy/CpxP family protein refolding chaperone
MLAKLVVMGLAIVLVAGSVSYAQGQRGGRGFGGGGTSKADLVRREQVQKELKITEEQTGKIKEITDAARASGRELFSGLRDLSEDERRAKFTELREKMTKAAEETGKKIAAVLNDTQNARLDQIVLQQRGNRALTSKDTIAKLNITKEQQQQIKDLVDAQGEMTRELFSGLRDIPREERAAKFAELGKKREEITTETNKAVMEVLTASQKTQFEQLKGAEFKLERGSFGRRRPGQGGNRRPQNNNN